MLKNRTYRNKRRIEFIPVSICADLVEQKIPAGFILIVINCVVLHHRGTRFTVISEFIDFNRNQIEFIVEHISIQKSLKRLKQIKAQLNCPVFKRGHVSEFLGYRVQDGIFRSRIFVQNFMAERIWASVYSFVFFGFMLKTTLKYNFKVVQPGFPAEQP